jgi:hypothetical protein
VLIAIGLFNYLFGSIFGLLSQFIAYSVLGTSSVTTAQIIDLALSTLVNIALPVALTLLYYDTRSREEGLDLALAAMDNPLARPIHVESPRPGSFLTSRDVVNVLALVGGGLVLVFLFGATFYALLDRFAPGLSSFQR